MTFDQTDVVEILELAPCDKEVELFKQDDHTKAVLIGWVEWKYRRRVTKLEFNFKDIRDKDNLFIGIEHDGFAVTLEERLPEQPAPWGKCE
jgi:hypothetical protein